MSYKIIKGDVTEWESEEKFHAALLDPPYELSFMGRKWDGSGVSFSPQTWSQILAQLYPGGFGLAFASPKLDHRMRVAMEDGGGILHPVIGWSYSSGFCKATRIDTQIQPQDEQEQLYQYPRLGRSGGIMGKETQIVRKVTNPTDELAQIWQQHRYGQQALAPAFEPIIMFQRPYEGKPVLDIIETGAGALWIEGTRIAGQTPDRIDPRNNNLTNAHMEMRPWMRDRIERGLPLKEDYINLSGRWPKNLLLQHSPNCLCLGEVDDSYTINRFDSDMHPFGNAVGESFSSEQISNKSLIWQCTGDCYVRKFAEANGVKKSGLMTPEHNINAEWGYRGGQRDKPTLQPTHADEGGVDRFFYQVHWAYDIFEQLHNADPLYYCAKASKSEKNAGLGNLSDKGKRWGTFRDNRPHTREGYIYTPKQIKNPHPSVKPLELCRYLATLLLPPAQYAPRRLYVPFAGSGSEIIGAMLAGWEEVVGVELDEADEYIPIAEARLEFWQWAVNYYGPLSPKEILKMVGRRGPANEANKRGQIF